MSSERGATLITGASGRIGRELALELIAAGEKVVAHSRHWTQDKAAAFDAAARQVGQEWQWRRWACDVQDALGRGMANLNAQLLQLHEEGRISHIVLNASMFERGQPWSGLTDGPDELELIRRHFEANVVAPWALVTALARPSWNSVPQPVESVVMLLDTYFDRPLPGYAAYQVSRAAGAGLVRALASELAPIRVNAVAPGTVLWSERPEAERAETASALEKRTVLGRKGSPADVIAAVRYLRDAEYTTGEILRVDGGRWRA